MQRGAAAVLIAALASACGGRTLPVSDGAVPGEAPVAADHGRPSTDLSRRDACVLPRGYCTPGGAECSTGETCEGCYACKDKAYYQCGCEIVDCPVCSSCIGRCVAGTCSTNKDCPSEYFCSTEGQCAVTGAKAGRCEKRPTACPEIACLPVCGCDGKTYCSLCEANAAGVSVATKNACLAATCAGLDALYLAEVKKAKQCCLMCASLQCVTKVSTTLRGCCTTFVNTTLPNATALQQEWQARGCDVGQACRDGECFQPPLGASCLQASPTTTTGTCIDFFPD
jgi:hypothetical protein